MLRKAQIRLLDADVLRSGQLERMERRQVLEARERETGKKIFLAPEAAVAALESGTRSVAMLTYCWAMPDGSDIDSIYVRALRRFLHSPLGKHIVGVFVESVPRGRTSPGGGCARGPHTALLAHSRRFEPSALSRSFMSLYQLPRSKAEDEAFVAGLGVMADLYASALGTTVTRPRAPRTHDSLSLDPDLRPVSTLFSADAGAAPRVAHGVVRQGALLHLAARSAPSRWRSYTCGCHRWPCRCRALHRKTFTASRLVT